MTIRRKSKRRSHVRIRRHSQNPSATHAGTATGAAATAKPTDEFAHFNPTESIERANWEPRLVHMTPVESAISNAADRQSVSVQVSNKSAANSPEKPSAPEGPEYKPVLRDELGAASTIHRYPSERLRQSGRHDSEVASRDRTTTTTQEEPDDSEANAQGENETTQSEQLPLKPAAEEKKNAVGKPLFDASRSTQGIEDDQNKGPVSKPIDTKSKSAEASSHDAVDFLMQDFMNSQPSTPTQEEATWDIKIEPRPLPKDSQIARVATISTLLVSILGIGSFIAYNKLVVPKPVVLGMASANVELPEPIHFSDGNGEQHAKHNPNERVAANTSNNPSAAQVQLSKQSTSKQIVPETTSSSTAASTENPAVHQRPEVASSGGPAPQSEASIGIPPNSNQRTASELTAATDRTSNAEATSEGSTQTDIEATYRQAVEKAFTLHKRSQRTKAKKEYQRALGINPNGAEALGKLAFYSLEESKYADAIELAERATRIDPNNSEGWIVLGAARQATEDRKGAMLAYRKCSESAGQYVKECRRLLR